MRILLVALLCAPSLVLAQTFEGLGDLPGGAASSEALAVSPDGRVVVGVSNAEGGTTTSGQRLPFRWENGEMVQLSVFPGRFSSSGTPTGISADGRIIVGTSSDDSQSGQVFVRWVDGEIERLSVSVATDGGGASGVSADGSVIVGGALRYPGPGEEDREAFRWENGTSQGLGYLPGDAYSGAADVSADGSVVVGSSSEFINEVFTPYRWAGTMEALPLPPGAFQGFAFGVSADGQVVVGQAGDINAFQATRWTASGAEYLPRLSGSTFSNANAASADGSTIVGSARVDGALRAWVWTEAEGTRDLRGVLEGLGLDLAGWTLERATDISDDGTVIVGTGINPSGNREAFRTVLGGAPELLISITAEPDTILVGTEFDVLAVVLNEGGAAAENVRPEGLLAITSDNGGRARVLSGPAPSALGRLAAGARDTLRYRAEAEALGRLEFELRVVGETTSGAEIEATPVCLLDGETGGARQAAWQAAGCSAEVSDFAFTPESAFMREDSLFWPDSTYTLRWSAPGAQTVEIHASLSLDPDPATDEDWITVVTGLDAAAGELEWTVPEALTGPDVRLRLRDEADPTRYAVSERARVRYGWHLTRIVGVDEPERRYEYFDPARHAWQEGLTEPLWQSWINDYKQAIAEKHDVVASALVGRPVEHGPFFDEEAWHRNARSFSVSAGFFNFEDGGGGGALVAEAPMPRSRPLGTSGPLTLRGTDREAREASGSTQRRRRLTLTKRRSYLDFRSARAGRLPNTRPDGNFGTATPPWPAFVHALGPDAVYGAATPTPEVGLPPEQAEVSPVAKNVAEIYQAMVVSGDGVCFGLASSVLAAFHEPDAFAARYGPLHPTLQAGTPLPDLPIARQALDVIAAVFTAQLRSSGANELVANPLAELQAALASDDPTDDMTLSNAYHTVLPYRVEQDRQGEERVLIHDRTYPAPPGNSPFENGTRTFLATDATGRILGEDDSQEEDDFFPTPERVPDLLSPVGLPVAQRQVLVGYRNEVEFEPAASRVRGERADDPAGSRAGSEPEPMTFMRNDPTLPPHGYVLPADAFTATVQPTTEEDLPELTFTAASNASFGYISDSLPGETDRVSYDPERGFSVTATRPGAAYAATLAAPAQSAPVSVSASEFLVAEVGPFTADAGQGLRWTWEAEGAPVARIRVENGAGAQSYSATLLHGNRAFAADSIAMAPGAIHTLRPAWDDLDTQPLPIDIDEEGDGTVDRTITVTNVLPVSNESADPAETLPEVFALRAYPNPTAGQATIELALPEAADVRAEVVDLLGRRVAVLADGPLAAGTHPLALDAARLPAGLYVVRAITPTATLTQRLTVVR